MVSDNAQLDGNELREQVIVVTSAGQGLGKAAAAPL
jgi:NAD(P)-dependent dehydrogenase (short-subunit alcohol dehydrogenase family)